FAGFARDAERILEAYHWPGNVRELKNVVERAVYRADDPEAAIDRIVLDPFDSPFRPRPSGAPSGPVSPPAGPYDFFARMEATEREALTVALAANGANQKRTAVYLGMAYHQLRNLLKKYDLPAGNEAQNSPQSGDKVEDEDSAFGPDEKKRNHTG